MPLISRLLLLLLAVPLAFALPSAQDPHDHDDHSERALPGKWYHERSHPVHDLFRRATNDGVTYAAVGSPEWYSAYPQGAPDSTKLPQAWVDALNAAVAAGQIPNIPQSSTANGGSPTYPQGFDPNGPVVCSSTAKCRNPDDIWDAPTGSLGTGFDDGPLPASTKLYQFLQANNQRATHFFIGVNILNNPQQFTYAFETLGDDIAVHTWTHPYMTTLSNLDIVAQLGWSMQLIHNSTGGRVTKYWRPPYGDSDNRVRAIAKVVFGMDTILWNQDTLDWSIGIQGGPTPQSIAAQMQGWLTGPKTPGLIILEHELSDASVQAFIDAYPVMKANNWNLISVAQMGPGGNIYQNANGTGAGTVSPKGILVNEPASSSSTSTSSTSSAPTTTTSSTPAGGNNAAHSNAAISRWPSIMSSSSWGWITIGLAILTGAGIIA